VARAFAQEDGNLSTVPITTSRNVAYKDIDLSFAKRDDGDIFKKTDAAAVKQSVKNLLLTNHTEKPFNPYFGGDLNRFLFDLSEGFDEDEIEETIAAAINNHEPRALLHSVRVLMSADNNKVNVLVQFQVVNTAEDVELNLELTRLR